MANLKITAISDLHGYLPEIQPADILLIAGDISPLEIQFNKPKMKVWLETEFAYWIKLLPVNKVFMVAGNHDGYFEGMNPMNLATLKQQCDFKLIYLENNWVVYRFEGKEVRIFGTPFCHVFGSWPFMRSDDYMTERFKEIPYKVDIIISHDPPYGIGQVDQILQSTRWSNQELMHVGNEPLAERLKEINYKLLVCGHIHSGDHFPFKFNNGEVVNVSLKDEHYNPIYEPFYTEIEI